MPSTNRGVTGAAAPLRILMVSAHYPPVLNGYAIQCGDTSEMLAAHGHEVRVLTCAEKPATAGGVRRIGALRCALPEERTSLQPRFLARQVRRRGIYRDNFEQCQAAARDFRPDIAILWQFAEIGIGVVHALQRRGIPVVFNVEDYSLSTVITLLRDPRSKWLGAMRRWMYDVAVDELDLSHLVLVSASLRASYLTAGFPSHDMTVIHNGIQASQIAAAPPPAGSGGRLLFVGRLHPTKGLTLAIEAFALATARSALPLTLDLVGTGEPAYLEEITTLATKLGVAASVRFLWGRTRAQVLELYRDYDVLLFPSVWAEPFGLTVIEAMAQGVPVVALDRGGPGEIISHGVDGLLVGEETPAAFAQAVTELVETPALRASMAAAAIRKVRDRFTLEQHVALTERLLHTIVDDRRAPHDGAHERKAS